MKWNEALTLILILQLLDRETFMSVKLLLSVCFCFFWFFNAAQKTNKGEKKGWFLLLARVWLCAHLSFCVFVINITDSDLDEICYVAEEWVH